MSTPSARAARGSPEAVALPDDLAAALAAAGEAARLAAPSPSCRRENLRRIAEARREATRARRTRGTVMRVRDGAQA